MLNDYVIAKKVHVSKVDNLVFYDLKPVPNAPSLGEIVRILRENTESLAEYHSMSKPPVRGRLKREIREAHKLLAQLAALEDKV